MEARWSRPSLKVGVHICHDGVSGGDFRRRRCAGRLPEKDTKQGQCASLRKWIYGMRGTTRGWEDQYTSNKVLEGVLLGKYAPMLLAHSLHSLRCIAHGGDFTFAGLQEEEEEEEDLVWAAGKMKSWHDVKVRGTRGPDSGDAQEIGALNLGGAGPTCTDQAGCIRGSGRLVPPQRESVGRAHSSCELVRVRSCCAPTRLVPIP